MVVAYNVLQVVGDMPATVAEAARVLTPGGRLCSCVAHPVTDLGDFLDDGEESPFALRSRYFESVRVEDIVERDGLAVTVRGWTYTLEDYASALTTAGFLIEAVREPKPDPFGDRYGRWRRIPMS